MLEVGRVYYVWVTHFHPPNDKYVVCVHARHRWFCIINSEPRRKTPEANVLIAPTELPCLTHDSYLDSANVRYFDEREIEQSIKREPWRDKGLLPSTVLKRISDTLSAHGHMPEAHKQAILPFLRV